MFNRKSVQNKIKKQAFSVYSPQNALERAIQDNSYEYEQEWLSAYPCRLMAKALCCLASFSDWLEDEKLLKSRISYFFNPATTKPRDVMVFVIYPVFLRDILENEEIDNHLHSPVTLVAHPLAHWLMRNQPIHIYIDISKLRDANVQSNWTEIGGIIIADENVKLPHKAINKITSYSKNPRIHRMVDEVIDQLGMRKVAATERERDVFYMDETERPLKAGEEVWDKRNRKKGTIIDYGLGEEGIIKIKYDDSDILPIDIPKMEFDKLFTVTSV